MGVHEIAEKDRNPHRNYSGLSLVLDITIFPFIELLRVILLGSKRRKRAELRHFLDG
jgi:hypothetical protein